MNVDVRSARLQVTIKREHLATVLTESGGPGTGHVDAEWGANQLRIKATGTSPVCEYVGKGFLSIKPHGEGRITADRLSVEIVGNDVVAKFDGHTLELVRSIGAPASFNQ
jgi:hypothetical protein